MSLTAKPLCFSHRERQSKTYHPIPLQIRDHLGNAGNARLEECRLVREYLAGSPALASRGAGALDEVGRRCWDELPQRPGVVFMMFAGWVPW